MEKKYTSLGKVNFKVDFKLVLKTELPSAERWQWFNGNSIIRILSGTVVKASACQCGDTGTRVQPGDGKDQ